MKTSPRVRANERTCRVRRAIQPPPRRHPTFGGERGGQPAVHRRQRRESFRHPGKCITDDPLVRAHAFSTSSPPTHAHTRDTPPPTRRCFVFSPHAGLSHTPTCLTASHKNRMYTACTAGCSEAPLLDQSSESSSHTWRGAIRAANHRVTRGAARGRTTLRVGFEHTRGRSSRRRGAVPSSSPHPVDLSLIHI